MLTCDFCGDTTIHVRSFLGDPVCVHCANANLVHAHQHVHDEDETNGAQCHDCRIVRDLIDQTWAPTDADQRIMALRRELWRRSGARVALDA